ncbi:hypothetical protein DFP72DRAFT_873826 [Ephemerocybe angulata]|uniref:Late embryogenesis abundant protein LEA-2 subgroup domain-containing protein n=1 Tax=Ephemerocybe angulata TaxID=980116 RepID=A0A8H6IFA9_9AGAR|nr:hypothetical protein DFP72DRAFT_873826 [Tulosesus angulatus]
MPAPYSDPYNNAGYGAGNQYNHQSDYNTPYTQNQDYDSTGPTYDPYSQNPPYGGAGNNVHFSDSQYDAQAPIPPSKDEPYDNSALPARHRSTRTTGGATSSLKSKGSLRLSVAPVRKHWNGFEHGEFTPTVGRTNGKTARAMKEYRYDARGNLWTKGGRGRCFGRFFCCTLMVAVLLIVSVVLTLALWIRPPAVTIGSVETLNTTGSLSGADGLTINLSVNISVNNPNYFTVDFSKLKAEIFYPINDTPMGGGESNNIEFKSNEHTNFTFPFALQYKSSNDPGSAVFVDLGTKCGLGGGPKSDIKVKYKITLGIRFLIITISPVIQNTFSFACPSSLSGGVLQGSTGS